MAERGVKVDVIETVGETDRFSTGLMRPRGFGAHHRQATAATITLFVIGESPQECSWYKVVTSHLFFLIYSQIIGPIGVPGRLVTSSETSRRLYSTMIGVVLALEFLAANSSG